MKKEPIFPEDRIDRQLPGCSSPAIAIVLFILFILSLISLFAV